jgi:hypothetical protein
MLPQTQCLGRIGQNSLVESLPTLGCQSEVDVSRVHQKAICFLVIYQHRHQRANFCTILNAICIARFTTDTNGYLVSINENSQAISPPISSAFF